MTTQASGSSDKSSSPQLGTFGAFGHHSMWQQLSPEQLRDIEALGYGAIWAGGSPAAELSWVDPILEETTTLKLATGIVNIWTAEPGPVAESFHRIEKAYPGRFLLGIGVGHPEAHAGVSETDRCAHRLSRQARRVRRAQGQPGGGRAWRRRC